MKRFIGEKICSKFYGSGIVEDIKKSGNKFQIIARFENRPGLVNYGFVDAIQKQFVWFVDADMQKVANVAIKRLGNKEIRRIERTAEVDIMDFLKSGDRENIDIMTNWGRIEILTKNTSYGTNGQEIYLKCCESFFWNFSEKGKFGGQKIMFSENAADGYSVWFLPHSNFTGDRAESGKWENYVSPPYIWEKYDNKEIPMTFGDKRITFVRMYNEASCKYEYVFMGIYQSYEIIKSEEDNLVLKYKRISEEYPE